MTETIVLISVIIGILITIFLSAFFSGSEMALSSCNLVRLENEAESGSKKAGIAYRLAKNFDDTLSAILIGNNLVNTASSSLSTVLVLLLTGTEEWTWLATLIITVLVIIFGETMPKMASKSAPNRMAKKVAPFIDFFRIIFFPIDFVVVMIVRAFTFFIKEKAPEEDESTEELQTLIDTAEDEGVLDSERSEMVSAAIDFSDISVSEAMTARVDVYAINIDSDRDELIEKALSSHHSRIPVYEERVDHIIGVLHLNHLLKALAEDPDCDIRSLLMEPLFVYRTMKLPQVLDLLKKSHQHLAIVTDEYSGTYGVVTLEDILEEIVGDIWDENDEVDPEVLLKTPGEWEIDGDMSIDDFLELLEIDPADFPYESETAGGFAVEYREAFPEVGDVFTFRNFSVMIKGMEERRVTKMAVRKLDF